MPDTADLGLLPAPVALDRTEGRLSLPNEVTVAATDPGADGADGLLELLRRLVQPGTGIRFVPTERDALFRFDVDLALPAGGYRLDVGESGIDLVVADATGTRSAVITLLQLLPADAHGPAAIPVSDRSLPCLHIEDHPRFGWRGMHLDVGRHFQPFNFLLRFVDLLELHRFNVFHLHLTEDQGWRFEVRKYPRLTEVGGWRTETWVPPLDAFDGTPHGGYYTQDQLRALVAYAADRGITVVPEIDLPGHVRALLAAYPHAGEGGETHPVATTFGIFQEVLNLTDETVAMVEEIFTELLEVFPSPYIHIGGDETPHTQWRASEQARELAAARGLAGVDDLQRWFTEHLRGWLAERGRTLVGWDEIVDGAHVPGATVMSWRGAGPGQAAAANGYDVVMAPETHTYFDYYQSSGPDEPYAIGGLTSLQKVLAFDPLDGVDEPHQSHIVGVQGQLWTEYLTDPQLVEYQAFPRACALAEIAWRGVAQPDFTDRLAIQLRRLDALGVNYRPLEGPRAWQRGGSGRFRRTV